MRAVNLIPPEDRRGGAGASGRSGGAGYVFLGGLAVVVVAVAAYVLTSNTITSRKAEVAKLQAQAGAAEQQAAALKPYRDFAILRRQRVATVSALASSRFDWDRALHELAIVLPTDSWLTAVTGSVAPGLNLESGGAGTADTSSLRQQVTAPALEITGCTVSQSEVSRVLARLRRIHGVVRVTLASSEKIDQSAATSGGGAPAAAAGNTGTDCRNGSTRSPQFSVVAFFSPLPGQTATAPGATPGAPAAPAPAPSGASTTPTSQPAATTSTTNASGSKP